MNNLNEFLSQEEFDELDNFLLERIDDEEEAIDRDEGILDMSDLDGFFTAIVSGPVMIPPSQWLPVIWGDCEPVWDSVEDYQRIFSLMIRHMNSIAFLLNEHPQEYEPVFMQHGGDEQQAMIVDEWCEGFMRGVGLDAKAWGLDDDEMFLKIAVIAAFTSTTEWQAHEHSNEEIVVLQHSIADKVRDIHAFWLPQRDVEPTAAEPIRRQQPRVGRNDPCPCGSGKKYKKCCLH